MISSWIKHSISDYFIFLIILSHINVNYFATYIMFSWNQMLRHKDYPESLCLCRKLSEIFMRRLALISASYEGNRVLFTLPFWHVSFYMCLYKTGDLSAWRKFIGYTENFSWRNQNCDAVHIYQPAIIYKLSFD